MTPGSFETTAELEALVETTSDVITVVDEGGIVQYQSPSSRDVMGYGPDELVGENAFEYIHPDDRQEALDLFAEMVETPSESTQRVEFRYDHGTDDWVWLESIGASEVADALDGYVITSRDITERKRRERKLREYEAAVETVPDGVFVVDATGTIIRSNDEWAAIVGEDPSEMRGESFDALVDRGLVDESTVEQYRDLVAGLLSSDADQRRGSFTTHAQRPEGDECVYEVHIGLLPADDGEFRGTAGAVRDITDRDRRHEQRRRENERLNEFADVISHDLRNPLNVLGMSLEAVEDGPNVERCRRAVDRMDELIEDLLVLARTGDAATDREPVHVGTVVSMAWDTVVTEQLTLDVRASRTVEADPGQLQQLFENLFRNCVEHALPDDPQRDVTVTVELTGDRLVVADDGTGFDDVDQTRLFEPGHSPSGGTGLGLRIVEQVVHTHGWEIRATDGRDGGARFEITGLGS